MADASTFCAYPMTLGELFYSSVPLFPPSVKKVLTEPISWGCSVVNCRALRTVTGYPNKCYVSLLLLCYYL